MEEYPCNSHKSKEESKLLEKKVSKVISGKAKTKKKGTIQKIADIFVPGDATDIKSRIRSEIFIPLLKKAIHDIITNTNDLFFYDEIGRKKSNTSKISYRSYYDDRRNYSGGEIRATGCDYDDIIFENRIDAEAVLDAMNDIIDTYGVVSVLDVYDLAEISTTNHATAKYGWTNISGCKAIRVPEGYVLKLPKARPIS